MSAEAALKFMSLGDAGARNHNFAPHESTVRAWIRARIRRLFHCHAIARSICWHSEKVILVGNGHGRVPHMLMSGCDKERRIRRERKRERENWVNCIKMQYDEPTYPLSFEEIFNVKIKSRRLYPKRICNSHMFQGLFYQICDQWKKFIFLIIYVTTEVAIIKNFLNFVSK